MATTMNDFADRDDFAEEARRLHRMLLALVGNGFDGKDAARSVAAALMLSASIASSSRLPPTCFRDMAEFVADILERQWEGSGHGAN